VTFHSGWYTEKYRRDEDDIDGQIKRMYVSDIKQAHEKLPQMTATIRGQDVRLDDRMNKLVWGGKAHMEDMCSGAAFGGGFRGAGGSRSARHQDEDDSTTSHARINILQQADDDDDDSSAASTKKRKRRKKKGRKMTKALRAKKEQELKAAERQKIVMQTTVVGVTIGAMALAAVTFLGGGSASKR
jgi:hypothetical protein